MKLILVVVFISIGLLSLQANAAPSIISPAKLEAWQKVTSDSGDSTVSGSETVCRITVTLKPRNEAWLASEALAVSDPKSAKYGYQYSLQAIADMVAPDTQLLVDFQRYFVEQWRAVDVRLAATRDSFVVDAPVAALEQALGLTFHYYRHAVSGRLLLRADVSQLPHRLAYLARLPSQLRPAVDTITGIHEFFSSPSEKKGFRRLVANLRSRHHQSQPDSLLPQLAADNGPDILPALATGADSLSISVIVYCQNGQRTRNASAPCSDFPPAAHDLVLRLENIGEVWSTNVGLDRFSEDCHYLASFDGVVCSFPETTIPAYRRVKVSAWTNYASGATSNVSVFLTEVAPTDYTTPRLVHQLYNIPANIRASNPLNSQAVAAFEGQYISWTDLSSFLSQMGLHSQNASLVGPNDPSQPGGESSLDIQSIMGVAPGVPTTFWSVGGDVKAQGGYILEFFLQLNNDTNAPLVSSISYGDTEDGYFNNYGSWDYINRCETELQKLALRRRTIVSGAGDAGVSNVGEDGNDLSPTDPTCTPFRPFYPADSPWVLGVGATFLSNQAIPGCVNQKIYGQPILCSQLGEVVVSVTGGLFWTTGGGFSNYFARYKYQNNLVNDFLSESSSILPPSTYWNSTGQAYPDISAIGHQMLIWIGGSPTVVDGTSMSSPITAAIISLLNEHLLNNGGSPLGCVNPLFYALGEDYPEVFYDVVVGTNKDGDWQVRGSSYPSKCQYGFQAAPGWDAASGLGTINYGLIVPHLPVVAPTLV